MTMPTATWNPRLAAPVRSATTVRRVLMTADTVGGVWTYALDLARGLGEHGVEVILATMGAPLSATQAAAAATVPGLTIHASEWRLEWMAGATDDVARAGEWLRQLAAKYQPDLVHLNGYAHAALPWHAPVVVVAHSCVQTWWRAVHDEPAPSEFDGYTRDLRRGLRAAARVVAPTEAFLAQLRQAHGRLPHAEVIPNGRASVGLAPARKEPFFLSVGRLWDEAKNVGTLARLAPVLPWPVRLAGDPTSPDGLHVPLANVDLLGHQTPAEVARWMARAAVYVSPARYEPFGLSILEAALSGCALVLSDIPTLREVWDEAALYVDPDDGAALAHCLRELARRPERRLRLARAASERARRYTIEEMTRRYLDLYQSLHDEATGANAAARAVSA